MKKPIFTGSGVAIVTPFHGPDLKINFPLFEEIIENHIKNIEEPKKVGTAYGYNPRTRRIEPLNY